MIRQQQYFEDAFNPDYSSIWKSSPIKFDYEEIYDLSYYRALGCFYNEDTQSLIDRRELLYNYLKADFNANNMESAINRYRSRLPITSLMNRILKNTCTLYNSEPNRIFTENENLNNTINSYYSNYSIDSKFQDIHRQARLYGTLAVRPMWVNGNLKIQVLTPDRFRVITNENDITKVEKLVYPIGTDNYSKIKFVVWTADEFQVYKDGKLETSEPNIYGEIPFAFIRFGYSNNFFTNGMFDNIEQQIYINKVRFLQQLGVTFQMNPIILAINMRNGNKPVTVTPDKVLTYDEVTEDVVMPHLDPVELNPQYSMAEEYISFLERRLLRNNGIPSSDIDGTDVVSGISRAIQRQELIEQRQSDMVVMRKFELDFINILALITEKDPLLPLEFGELSFSIDYDEERLFLEPDVERANDFERMKSGLIDPLNYITKWGDFDTNVNEDKIIKEFARRKELFNKLFTSNEENNNNNANNTLNNLENSEKNSNFAINND